MAEASIEWLSGDALEAQLSASGSMLLVFVAEWCEPCQALVPRLERLAVQQRERLRCYLVDVDRDPYVAQKYGVRGMPTLALFEDGDLDATRVGALDDTQLASFMETALDA
ncbi:thioredoxin family protein [Modicisalibacter radicis]|uniref:thioredoxin family protein n=1 Tax=Halomonas sp. EAR18 TaxID=2518972 RepID=UPI001443C108|nr:thioredoxin family protein [Halomonas sp. EAR18]